MHNGISEPGRRVRIYAKRGEFTVDGWFEVWSRTMHGSPCAVIRADDGSVGLYNHMQIQFIDVPIMPPQCPEFRYAEKCDKYTVELEESMTIPNHMIKFDVGQRGTVSSDLKGTNYVEVEFDAYGSWWIRKDCLRKVDSE